MNAKQLSELIIHPVLQQLNTFSIPAAKLLLGTAAVESNLGQYLHQTSGPALGIYQCEPKHLVDVCKRLNVNFLDSMMRFSLTKAIFEFEKEIIGNLYLATAVCRGWYLLVEEPIPNTAPELAAYWKKYYNSRLGKGTTEKFLEKYSFFKIDDIFKE